MSLDPGAVSEVCYVVHDLEKSVRNWAEATGAGPFYVVEGESEDEALRHALDFVRMHG